MNTASVRERAAAHGKIGARCTAQLLAAASFITSAAFARSSVPALARTVNFSEVKIRPRGL